MNDVKSMLRALWRYRDRLPHVLFAISLVLVGFAWGYGAGRYKWFPRPILLAAKMTYANIKFQFFQYGHYQIDGVSAAPAAQVERLRFKSLTGKHFPENFLITGGPYQFREFCPRYGCLAVELSRQGKLISAVPFLPSEFLKTPMISLPYEQLFFKPEKDLLSQSVFKIAGGDYIFNIGMNAAFPYGGGIARIRQDGTIVWYRRDYAHHWSAPLPNGDIVTPARASGDTTKFEVATSEHYTFGCETLPSPMDEVEVLDRNGHLKKELSIFRALVNSPFRGHLVSTLDPCDITHMNFVRAVGQPLASRLSNTSSDDYLVSLRHISAFMIVDRNTGFIKSFYRGTFTLQHSVLPTPDGKVIMFDNNGGDYVGGPSRVLEYDPVTHSERTVFPNKSTPTGLPLHTATGGFIDISPDGTRAIVSFAERGRAYEIDLKTGTLLTSYDNIHNMQGLSQYPGDGTGKAVRAFISQISYAN